MKKKSNLNFNWLYYFYVFNEEEGVFNASLRLGISQPVVSVTLKKVRDLSEVKLTKKIGTKVVLTENGKRLMEVLSKMYKHEDEIRSILSGNKV